MVDDMPNKSSENGAKEAKQDKIPLQSIEL
jgi:hypothetical protein